MEQLLSATQRDVSEVAKLRVSGWVWLQELMSS